MYFLAKLCRLCVQSKPTLVNLESEDYDKVSFTRKLELCTRMVFKPDEEVSKEICSTCVQKLRISYEFLNMCKKSTGVLNGYISKLVSASTDINSNVESFPNTNIVVQISKTAVSPRKRRIGKSERCAAIQKIFGVKTHDFLQCNNDQCLLTVRNNQDKARGGLKDLLSFTKSFDFGFNNNNYDCENSVSHLDKLIQFSESFFYKDFANYHKNIVCVIQSNDFNDFDDGLSSEESDIEDMFKPYIEDDDFNFEQVDVVESCIKQEFFDDEVDNSTNPLNYLQICLQEDDIKKEVLPENDDLKILFDKKLQGNNVGINKNFQENVTKINSSSKVNNFEINKKFRGISKINIDNNLKGNNVGTGKNILENVAKTIINKSLQVNNETLTNNENIEENVALSIKIEAEIEENIINKNEFLQEDCNKIKFNNENANKNNFLGANQTKTSENNILQTNSILNRNGEISTNSLLNHEELSTLKNGRISEESLNLNLKRSCVENTTLLKKIKIENTDNMDTESNSNENLNILNVFDPSKNNLNLLEKQIIIKTEKQDEISENNESNNLSRNDYAKSNLNFANLQPEIALNCTNLNLLEKQIIKMEKEDEIFENKNNNKDLNCSSSSTIDNFAKSSFDFANVQQQENVLNQTQNFSHFLLNQNENLPQIDPNSFLRSNYIFNTNLQRKLNEENQQELSLLSKLAESASKRDFSGKRSKILKNTYINPKLQRQYLLCKFKCDTCNRYFKSNGYLKAHNSKVHSFK